MKRILVIDDEPDVRGLIVEILCINGYEAIGAEDGDVGVPLARQYLPDLILCDVRMPRLDGYTTLEALRADPVTALIPFIFLTGKADREDMRKGMDLGADDYITKPFTAPELLAAVRSRLERQEMIAWQSEKKLEDLRGNIIYALPHELLTPLTAILGFSKFLAADYAKMDRAKIGEMAGDIHASANRLHRLIQNFLVYAQIEVMAADPAQLEALRRSFIINPVALISDVARQRASQSGREADLGMELTNASVRISEENLKKIVEEIVDNAFKFSQPGSPVRVVTTILGDRYLIEVSDRGRGMTPEQMANVGAYMQFGRKLYEQQGSGLGLILAKRIAELHEGTLTLQSVPDQPTLVTVTLKHSPRL